MNPTTFRLITTEDRVGLVRSVMLSLGFTAITLGVICSVVAMVKRLWRSEGEQRQQLRLIATSAALAAVGLSWLFVIELVNSGDQTRWWESLPLFVAYFLLPIFFAVAVLRHRLYELDVIINRTAVLGAATVFAAVGYTTLVVAVGSLADKQTGGFWLSLLVTALVAVAFQPVRHHVVRLANRLAYGSRAQPYEELADFSSRLAETPSVDRLLPAVAAAAGQALAATSARAAMGRREAVWGDPSSATAVHRVPVAEDLGALEVAIPRGRRLRPADERLLRALADQAAVAFRNASMEAELAAHVEALDRATAELARSRARVIEADDAVRRDLEEAISRDVLPHLLAVARGLQDGGDVEPMVESVNRALGALRELTRGLFPTQLTRSGVEAALRSLPITVAVDPGLRGRRFPPRVEAAVWFVCATTASLASAIELAEAGNQLLLTVRGVSSCGDNLRDRVEAAGGSLAVADHTLSVRLPAASAHASTSRSGPNIALAT
jgi:hypothetical protein